MIAMKRLLLLAFLMLLLQVNCSHTSAKGESSEITKNALRINLERLQVMYGIKSAGYFFPNYLSPFTPLNELNIKNGIRGLNKKYWYEDGRGRRRDVILNVSFDSNGAIEEIDQRKSDGENILKLQFEYKNGVRTRMVEENCVLWTREFDIEYKYDFGVIEEYLVSGPDQRKIEWKFTSHKKVGALSDWNLRYEGTPEGFWLRQNYWNDDENRLLMKTSKLSGADEITSETFHYNKAGMLTVRIVNIYDYIHEDTEKRKVNTRIEKFIYNKNGDLEVKELFNEKLEKKGLVKYYYDKGMNLKKEDNPRSRQGRR